MDELVLEQADEEDEDEDEPTTSEEGKDANKEAE